MSRASLLFEDDPETGQIIFRADFKGGYDPRSPAHKTACTVISFLDKECHTRHAIDTAPTDALQNGNGHA